MNLQELECYQAAEKLAHSPTKSTLHMGHAERVSGIAQMLIDLYRLANEDGCIAAGWAYEKCLEDAANTEGAGHE